LSRRPLSRATKDALVLLIVGIVAFLIGRHFDVMDFVFDLAEAHEEYELDEIILAIFVCGMIGFIYAFRRNQDMKREIDLRHKAQAETGWIAGHDPMTRLPNRRNFEKHCAEIQAGGQSVGKRYTVLAIDLDGFKRVNDLVGHEGGNELLVEVAARLTRAYPDDHVARVGGDEFIVVASPRTDVQAVERAQELIASLTRPITIQGLPVQVGASVGVASYPQDSSDLREVAHFADVAMYIAKRQGRNLVRVFEPSMAESAAERTKTEMALRNAISADEIVPHYQPLIDLSTGKVRGFEALARWTKADGTSVPPLLFIPLAEEAGLITVLSEKLLNRACRDASSWPAEMTLSFNISPMQMTDALLGARIVQTLAATGLAPNRLEVEITESAMVQDVRAAAGVVSSLHAAGIKVALDDFGTGYSSLSQLSQLKFDKVKIDRSFVAAFEGDEKQEKIVRAIIGLGHGLGIVTTAEGIEDRATWKRLQEMGCDFGQGYLFGKAMAPNQVSSFLDTFAVDANGADRSRILQVVGQ
jgi:diguanylate cyclase (GGDEF)-like protein